MMKLSLCLKTLAVLSFACYLYLSLKENAIALWAAEMVPRILFLSDIWVKLKFIT